MQVKLLKDKSIQITEGDYLTTFTKDVQVIKKRIGRRLIVVASVVGDKYRPIPSDVLRIFDRREE